MEKVCSYCRESGHFANHCPKIPLGNTLCLPCGKMGHGPSTCLSKKGNDSVNFARITAAENTEKDTRTKISQSMLIMLASSLKAVTKEKVRKFSQIRVPSTESRFKNYA